MPGKDYLAVITPEKGSQLLHKVTTDWDESKVKRDAGGQFSNKAEKRMVNKLVEKQTKFMLDKYGPSIKTLTPTEYIEAVPKDQQDALSEQLLSDIITLSEARQALLVKLGRADDTSIWHDDSDGEPLGGEIEASIMDALHHGIKGMKWGIRRTDSQIAQGNQKLLAKGQEITPTEKAKTPVSGTETAPQRYARLAAVAKGGGASSMSEEDLKFFNARTEAIAKVNRMFETKPGWLQSTAKDIAQNVAKQQMQSIAGSMATKYIGGPIIENITSAQKKANDAAIKKGIDEGLKKSTKTSPPPKPAFPLGFQQPKKKP